MRLRLVLPFILMAVLSLTASAQSAEFNVEQNGHPVGTASFHFTSGPQGVDSRSLVRVKTQGLEYALSKDGRLTAANQIQEMQLSATVNGSAVTAALKPDSGEWNLEISANGRHTNTHLPIYRDTVLLPDFDPGALQTLLTLAAHKSGELWAIIPKQAGAIDPVQLSTYADLQGTLDGKPLTVHHIMASTAGAQTEIFSGPQDQLLQAELPQEGFALVRKGFVLRPPAKAPATPPAPQ